MQKNLNVLRTSKRAKIAKLFATANAKFAIYSIFISIYTTLVTTHVYGTHQGFQIFMF